MTEMERDVLFTIAKNKDTETVSKQVIEDYWKEYLQVTDLNTSVTTGMEIIE